MRNPTVTALDFRVIIIPSFDLLQPFDIIDKLTLSFLDQLHEIQLIVQQHHSMVFTCCLGCQLINLDIKNPGFTAICEAAQHLRGQCQLEESPS